MYINSLRTLDPGQNGNHAEEIYSEKFLWSKLDYIHLNPVRSGIVSFIPVHQIMLMGRECWKRLNVVDNPIVDVLKEWNVVKYNSY